MTLAANWLAVLHCILGHKFLHLTGLYGSPMICCKNDPRCQMQPAAHSGIKTLVEPLLSQGNRLRIGCKVGSHCQMLLIQPTEVKPLLTTENFQFARECLLVVVCSNSCASRSNSLAAPADLVTLWTAVMSGSSAWSCSQLATLISGIDDASLCSMVCCEVQCRCLECFQLVTLISGIEDPLMCKCNMLLRCLGYKGRHILLKGFRSVGN